MSLDISKILTDWEYEPEQVSVRAVPGDDGREKIQLRLDLGVLQMEVAGRPDGARIDEFESWLAYYEHQKQQHELEAADVPFTLETSDCAKLLREGFQYYHRYLSFWHLERYDECARDTARNLRLFAFVREHAADVRDRLQFDQWRPYVTLMYTRAVATPQLAAGEKQRALAAIDRGIEGIVEFLEQYDQLKRADSVGELNFLKHWRAELLGEPAPAPAQPPLEGQARLRHELNVAIEEERYEDAARIRDELSGGPSQPNP